MTPNPPPFAASTLRSRYPGTHPFGDSPDDRARFFGREEEAEELYLRVLSVPLLVQFGKSGLGKTSLLQAGLFPRLRQKAYLPVMIRFNLTDDSLMTAVTRAFDESCEGEPIDFRPGDTSGLWEYLSTTTAWRDDLFLTPVLVFDQFEEVFTLRDAAFRTVLAAEIGAVASGIPPARLNLGRGASRPDVKIVISLREDYLGALEEFSQAIPDLFHERLRLEPLDPSHATEAIIGPGRLEADEGEVPYASPRFEFEKDALERLIEFLKGTSGIIEPFQLQLLCRYAERVAQTKGLAGPVTLVSGDFPRKALESVLKNFYRDTLAKIPSSRQRQEAERLCEEGLLGAAGHRLSLEERQILDEYDLSRETLGTLCAERLLRGERRLDSVFYEISHDRLAESIFDTRKTKIPARTRRIFAATIAVIVAVAAIVVVVLLMWNRSVSAEREIAEKERHEAEGLLTFLLGEQFLGEVRHTGRSTMLEQVQSEVRKRGGAEARGAFNYALSMRTDADLERMHGRLAHSVRLYKQALETFRGIPIDRPALREIAKTHESLAVALQEQGKLTEALAEYTAADQAWVQVTQKKEGVVVERDDCVDRAGQLAASAGLRHRMGGWTDVTADLDKSAAIALDVLFGGNEFCAAPPSAVDAHPPAEVINVLAEIALVRSFQFAWEEDADAAAALAEQALALDPASVDLRRDGIVSLAFRAQTEQASERLADYREAFKVAEELRRWDPKNRGWQRDRAAHQLLVAEGIATCHAERARCKDLPSLDAAEAMVLEALALLRSLSTVDATNMLLQSDIGWGLQTHARVLAARGRHAEALVRLNEAERIHRASRRDDTDTNNTMYVSTTLRETAAAQAALGRHAEAVATQRQAVGVLSDLAAAHPQNSVHRMLLQVALVEQAGFCRTLGDKACAAAADAEFERLLEAAKPAQAALNKHFATLIELDATHYQKAHELMREEKYAEALAELRASEKAVRDFLRINPSLYTWYESLSVTYDLMADAYEALEKPDDVAAARRSLVNAAQLASWLAVDDASRKKMDVALLDAAGFLAIHLHSNQNLPAALAMMQEVVSVAERLAERPQPDPDHLRLLGISKCLLGQFRFEAKTAGWEEAVRSGLITIRTATEREPEYVRHEGVWHEWLGESLTASDRPEEARVEFQAALTAYRRVARRRPDDPSVQEAIQTLTARLD